MSKSYPRPGYNGGSVTTAEHEVLVQSSMPDGVRGDPANTATPIYADGTGTRVVKLRADLTAFIRGSVYQSDNGVILPSLAANTSGQPRIDLIVLRLDRSDYSVNPVAITGTPAANPVAPSPVRNTGSAGFYDVPLAEVQVANNAVFLASTTVTNKAWFVGDDGQIRCEYAARPPHDRGRVIWEHPTGVAFMSNGSQWLRAVDNESGLVTPVSGINFPYRFLHRRNGMVTMGLTIHRPNGTFGSGTWTRIGEVVGDDFTPIIDMQLTGVVPSTGQVFTGIVEVGGSVLVNPGAQSITPDRYLTVSTLTWPVA